MGGGHDSRLGTQGLHASNRFPSTTPGNRPGVVQSCNRDRLLPGEPMPRRGGV